MDAKIVSVRFNPMGKAYHFDTVKVAEVRKGDYVVVETSRGWQLGQVVNLPEKPAQSTDGSWKQIDRIATPQDLVMRQSWQMKETDVKDKARQRATELKLKGVKIINAEYSFDGSRLSITYSTESEEKVELKSLRSDMQKAFAPAQVDIRQIGPRDVAKVFNGIGACGLEHRCCSTFLTEFCSISIRMAKEQGISLTPSEITGICGRLRCCLNYEYEQYCAMRQELPRKNKRVMTPMGEGKVVDVATLRQRVIVDIPETGRREFNKDEITLLDDDTPAPQAKEPQLSLIHTIPRPLPTRQNQPPKPDDGKQGQHPLPGKRSFYQKKKSNTP
ncbi:MAG: hypothetical protein C0391_09700 [Anaerolinea sp.]|nr:hypothetical protein [Anaerolinea sp.]